MLIIYSENIENNVKVFPIRKFLEHCHTKVFHLYKVHKKLILYGTNKNLYSHHSTHHICTLIQKLYSWIISTLKTTKLWLFSIWTTNYETVNTFNLDFFRLCIISIFQKQTYIIVYCIPDLPIWKTHPGFSSELNISCNGNCLWISFLISSIYFELPSALRQFS